MTLRTLIIDDEPIALEKLKSYVERTPQLALAAACSSVFEAMEHLRDHEADLIVTDINMPDLNGLDFVRTLSCKPLVIFATAYPQYAIDGYKVAAVDYLLKPYGYADFCQAIARAQERMAGGSAAQAAAPSAADESVFVKVDYKFVRISLADIRFIKGYGEYLQIYIAGKSAPLMTLSSFAAIRELLSPAFVQIHRSYIVNMNHVVQIERNRVVMDEKNHLPVGESFKQAFQAYLASRSTTKK